jgi:hypothetical protein
MKRILIWSAPVLMLAQAAVAGVKTDYDHGAQFAQYHTFQWMAMPAPANGVVDNAITVDRVKRSIGQQLTKKGLEETNNNPDVYLVYHFNASNRIEYMPYYGWGGRRGWWGPGGYAERFAAGSLTIDIVDARTNRLVWRAYCGDRASNVIDVQNEKNVNKMVGKAFSQYPPKSAHT